MSLAHGPANPPADRSRASGSARGPQVVLRLPDLRPRQATTSSAPRAPRPKQRFDPPGAVAGPSYTSVPVGPHQRPAPAGGVASAPIAATGAPNTHVAPEDDLPRSPAQAAEPGFWASLGNLLGRSRSQVMFAGATALLLQVMALIYWLSPKADSTAPVGAPAQPSVATIAAPAAPVAAGPTLAPPAPWTTAQGAPSARAPVPTSPVASPAAPATSRGLELPDWESWTSPQQLPPASNHSTTRLPSPGPAVAPAAPAADRPRSVARLTGTIQTPTTETAHEHHRRSLR